MKTYFMKKISILLMAMLMSISISASAGTTTSKSNTKSSRSVSIPTNLKLKQTITFNDGKTITVYYQKEGTVFKLYSADNLKGYNLNDLNRVKASNFEVADHVEGRCITTKSLGEVISMAKSLLR